MVPVYALHHIQSQPNLQLQAWTLGWTIPQREEWISVAVPHHTSIFATINSYFRGRLIYAHSDNSFNWQVGGTTAVAMKLIPTGLSVTGTVTSSDKTLKFSEQPLMNALDVINRLEPVEYDQTVDLIEQYTEDTPQFHQCGFIAQTVQQIEEL